MKVVHTHKEILKKMKLAHNWIVAIALKTVPCYGMDYGDNRGPLDRRLVGHRCYKWVGKTLM